MLKKFALIMLLLGSSIASTAWAQTDCTDDDSAADECAEAVDEVSEVDAGADADEGALTSGDEEADEDANEPGDVDADDDAAQDTDETAEDEAIEPADASSIDGDKDEDAGKWEPAPEPDATPPPLNPQDPVVAPAPNSAKQPCETLQQKFDCARVASEHLSERPDYMTMLKIHALYQQGSVGDVQGMRPGPADMSGRAKFDSWAELKGTSKDDAMGEYIALIDELTGE
ncbi:MAG: acyl-CoA-binding protein [Lysobacterales bacterium]